MAFILDLPLELLIHILSTMSLQEMRQFMRTNKQCRELGRQFLQRKYDLVLRPYIEHRHSFRTMLRHTRSVISGSTAVDFGMHGLPAPPFDPSDLDLYAGAAHALTVIHHLRFVEGYTANPLTSFPPRLLIDDYDGGIASVVRMTHPDRPKIDVIASARISALHPLSFFWSTLPMVYLTADGFCAAYPQLLFNARACFNPTRCSGARVKECLKKYVERGFDVQTFAGNDAPPHVAITDSDSDESCLAGGFGMGSIQTRLGKAARRKIDKLRVKKDGLDAVVWVCPHVPRRFGDAGSFSIAFDGKSGSSNHSRFPFEEPEWIMGGPYCGGSCGQITETSVVPWAPML